MDVSTSPSLQGRAFERLHRFAALPANFQDDTKQFQEYVERSKQTLFETNYHALVIPVYSVKGIELITAILQWLQTCTSQPGKASGPRAAATISSSKTRGTPFSLELLVRAKQIAEALVLSGFLTPYKHDESHTTRLNLAAPDHYVQANELLIPVAKNINGRQTTSVWSIADGAIFAGYLKRKAGVLSSFAGGSDIYVVLNERTKKAYLFESDIARESITEMSGDAVTVQFDEEHFEFGVLVTLNVSCEKAKPELFNARSIQEQEDFMNAWLSIGAQYHELNTEELLEASARGLVGPEADHNAQRNLTVMRHEIPIANVAAADILCITPTKICDPLGTGARTVPDPPEHQDRPLAAKKGRKPVQARHTSPSLASTVAAGGLGTLRLPLGALAGKFCLSLLARVADRSMAMVGVVTKSFTFYQQRRRGLQ